jgi:hypothetical protein
MITALPMLMLATGIENLAMNTVLMIVVMGINSSFTKDV